MKSIHITLFTLFLFVCANLSNLTAKPQNLNFIDIQWEIDGRAWMPASSSRFEENEGIIKFFPRGSTTDNWSEMVTTQWYENLFITPSAYFHSFMSGLRDIYGNTPVTQSILSKTGDISLLAEWKTNPTDNEQSTYGLVKVFSYPPHIYLLSYTLRDPSKMAAIKKTWLPMMRKAKLNCPALEREEVSPSLPNL